MNENGDFSSDIYTNIGLDQLLVYSVYRVISMNEECTFERLVYECFILFPKVFGFIRYPDWPDSSRINKSWLRCRTDRGWLTGKIKEGFRLTASGENIARKVEQVLMRNIPIEKAKVNKKTRERYEAVIDYIQKSEALHKFNNGIEISHSEYVTFLGGTLETPIRIWLS